MKKKNYSGQIYDAVGNYYQYNPDTLMYPSLKIGQF